MAKQVWIKTNKSLKKIRRSKEKLHKKYQTKEGIIVEFIHSLSNSATYSG